MSDFAGKSVIVTGGSLGMGLACATRFVQGGADVLIVANDKASIETALASLGPQVRGLVGDVRKAADMQAAAAEAASAFGGVDILSVYRPEAMAALPLLYILVAGRAIEAIVGPASVIVEMTGHRLLPLVNSLIAFALWGVLAWLLVPAHGGIGMAIAVAVATVASTYAATVELQISDGLNPFGRRLVGGLAIACVGVAAMWGVTELTRGPVRFALVIALWALTSRFALRHGLTREDRLALGGLSRLLRLV